MLAALEEEGFDTSTALNDLKAMRAHLVSLNQGQLHTILAASDNALANLDALDEIVAKNGDPSIWDRVSRQTGDLQAAAKSVRESLALLNSGGAKTNDLAIKQAEKDFGTGLFSGKLGPKIKRLKAALGIRVASIKGAYNDSDVFMGRDKDPNDPFGMERKQ